MEHQDLNPNPEETPQENQPILPSEEELVPSPPPAEEVWGRNRLDLSKVEDAVDTIKTELRKVIIGQSEMIDLLLAALFTNGHVLIEGVPGIAKTLTAKLLAQTLKVGFSRIQFTPDLMPADITGTDIIQENPTTGHRELIFEKGPVFTQMLLADEINRTYWNVDEAQESFNKLTDKSTPGYVAPGK